MTRANAHTFVAPLDEHNAELLAHVRPAGWRDPADGGPYDLVVIGGGTAGLVSAAGAAGLGARVALIERGLLGGDCLNAGCVPSKAMLRSARAVRAIREGAPVGVAGGPPRVDFGAVMARLRQRRAAIAEHDSAARLASAGVDVFFGQAAFAGRRVVAVGGRRLAFRKAVIATGGRPAAPPIPGLADVPYLTNENLFWLTEQPRELIVLGAGPIGCEMAQAFALLGTRVTLIESASQVLPREDGDAVAIVQRQLVADGVRLELGATVRGVGRDDRGVRLTVERKNRRAAGLDEVSADQLLVAVGRSPNVEELGLAAAGIRHDERGVLVNDRLQTTNARVFAAGDVCSPFKFTHAADAMARLAIQNALFFGRRRASALVIPWCTYTCPEVARVGIGGGQAADDHNIGTITVPLQAIDRAVVDDETDGFIRVHHRRGRLLGCTIVASHAGELIGQVAYAMQTGGGLATLSNTVYPYPTVAEGLRKAGDAYRRSRLTPAVRRWLERYFRWTR